MVLLISSITLAGVTYLGIRFALVIDFMYTYWGKDCLK
jgi:hypothetical protein